jgi:hypothetical protein
LANRYIAKHVTRNFVLFRRVGNEIFCVYSAFGGLLTVTTSDGRQKIAQLASSSSPVTLARKILIEMELEKKDGQS